MKYKALLIVLFLAFFLFSASGAKASTIELLRQQIEILKFEVSLLQSLLKNMQSKGGITAKSYMAVNLADNSVLLEKNKHQLYPTASITKLMTALIATENTDNDLKITLTQEMLKPLGASPSLYLGLNVSAENLLKASLIQSSNDASESLAYSVGKQKFIQLMNQKAKELGMLNTIFYDAHGLNKANVATASDLVKLLSYIYKNHSEVLQITRNNDFWLPDKTGLLLKFQNVNNFYPLSGFIGGKAGYLTEARQAFAGVFEVKGESIAVVVLRSSNRQADVFAILQQLGK